MLSDTNSVRKKTTCWMSSKAFKNGALMLRNIGSPLSNACRQPIFERIYFRYFVPFLKPLFSSVFVAKQFFETPQTRAEGYFLVRKDKKMKKVKNGGSLRLEQINLKPLFLQHFLRQNRKRPSALPLRCPFLKQENVAKTPRPGGQCLFSPQHPDYEKNQKIYWPLLVGHTQTTGFP